jgi:DNA-binding transcriptional LysR family regulator
MICASPAHLAARGTPRTPDDLAGRDCISYAAFGSPDAWRFVRDGADVAIPVHARLIVGSAEAAIDAACAGIGITWAFSYHFKPALERGALTSPLDDGRFISCTRPTGFCRSTSRSPDLLGMCKRTVSRQINAGPLAAHRSGGAVRIAEQN